MCERRQRFHLGRVRVEDRVVVRLPVLRERLDDLGVRLVSMRLERGEHEA